MRYRWVLMVIGPAVAAYVMALLYPFIGGGFAVSLTLMAFIEMYFIVGVGLTVSAFVVRPLLQRRTSAVSARWIAVGILILAAAIVNAIFIVVALAGTSTAAGGPNMGLLAPVGSAATIVFAVYAAATLAFAFVAVRRPDNRLSPAKTALGEV